MPVGPNVRPTFELSDRRTGDLRIVRHPRTVGPTDRRPPHRRTLEPSNLRTGMDPRVTVITLGVDDLERALRFYRDGLGLPTPGIVGTEFDHGAVVFIELQAGVRLALWPRASIAHDSGLPVTARSATELTLGNNVRSREEVDVVMAQAEKAGATIVKRAHETFWGGYAGYFQDPDGHLWEVVWNPQLMP